MAKRKYTNLHKALHQQTMDYYANLQAETERIQREEAERAARLDREDAARKAARELPEWEREWLLLNEEPQLDEDADLVLMLPAA
jgi:hypothetical protein